MTIFSLGFEGLPYISPKYGGDKNVAIRAKIKNSLSTIGTIKKLFIDENKNNGRTTYTENEVRETIIFIPQIMVVFGSRRNSRKDRRNFVVLPKERRTNFADRI